MKRTAKPAASPPPEPDQVFARDLVVETLKFAVATYREALRQYAEGWRLHAVAYPDPGGKDEGRALFDAWVHFRTCVMTRTSDLVIEGILLAHGRAQEAKHLKNLGADWPACAWELDKVVYVVSQDPDDDDYHPTLAFVETSHFDADWGDS